MCDELTDEGVQKLREATSLASDVCHALLIKPGDQISLWFPGGREREPARGELVLCVGSYIVMGRGGIPRAAYNLTYADTVLPG